MFGKTDETDNKKVHTALAVSLEPNRCVGKTQDDIQACQAADVVSRQVRADIEGVAKDLQTEIIFAYEPIWAIGTRLTATSAGRPPPVVALDPGGGKLHL